MEMWDIDTHVLSYIQNGEYEQAEQFLREQYTEVKARGNSTALRHILLEIAHFYCLPFKKHLRQAEVYYREMESTFPDRETDLRIAMFYFYNLRDFTKTVDRVSKMGAVDFQNKKDIQFYYSALALKGQALLCLNRDQQAATILKELERIIAAAPRQVPFGDEFNFLNEMTQRKREPELCKELTKVIIARIKDQEFKDKFLALLDDLEKPSDQ